MIAFNLFFLAFLIASFDGSIPKNFFSFNFFDKYLSLDPSPQPISKIELVLFLIIFFFINF